MTEVRTLSPGLWRATVSFWTFSDARNASKEMPDNASDTLMALRGDLTQVTEGDTFLFLNVVDHRSAYSVWSVRVLTDTGVIFWIFPRDAKWFEKIEIEEL